MNHVTKVYGNMSQAREAVRRLRDTGFPADAISLIAKNSDEVLDATEVEDLGGNAPAEAAVGGAAAGIGLGALVGLVMAGSSIVLPGLGAILIAGPLVAALTGAGVGGASGGLLGALIGAGVPEEDAAHHVRHLENGSVLVSVMVENDQALVAREVLEEVTTIPV